MTRQPSGPGACATAHPFVFVGGHLALDFVNTVMVEGRRTVDRISTPDELAAWVAVSELGPHYGVPTQISEELHAQAIRVRAALKASFDAVTAGEAVPDGPLRILNAALRLDPGSELRRRPSGELIRCPNVDLTREASVLPWLVADAGANLLAGHLAAQLRRCANHDTCVLIFLDTSRSRNRRWCSMDLCGNRSKVAAHDARRRRRRASEGS